MIKAGTALFSGDDAEIILELTWDQHGSIRGAWMDLPGVREINPKRLS